MKIKQLLKNTNRTVLAVIVGAILVAVPIAATLMPQTANASGESFSWDPNNKNNIIVSYGGSQSTLNSRGITSPGTEVFLGNVLYQGRCTIQASILVTGPNSAQAFPVTQTPSVGAGGTPHCSDIEVNSFNDNTSITIAGTRGTGTPTPTPTPEAPGNREIHLDLSSVTAEVPATVAATLKDGNGKVIDGPTTINRTDDQGTHHFTKIYTNIDQGPYSLCFDSLIGCQNFTKIRNEVFYANFSANQIATTTEILTEVQFTFDSTTAAGDQTFGPYTIALQDTTGKDLGNNAETTQLTVKALGGGAASNAKHDVNLQAHTKNVATGKYQVCLTDIGKCVNVEKVDGIQGHAIIKLNSEETAALLSGDNKATRPTCETTDDNNAYILCPIFNGVSGFTDWMFNNIIQPFLYTSPISTSANDPSFKVWSTFRIYGDIFLVFALLIIVFGESIGGGLIDAYTARKALPRVLAAAILINLSVYIVALLVDITNIAGGALGHIITAPIDLSFQPTAAAGNTALAGGIIGLIMGAGGLATILTGLFTLKASFIKAALWVGFFAMLPVFLAIVLIFIVLVVRKGIILALILVSPVAFALYCLPMTEKYFRRWWRLLTKSLLIYPVVVVLFAVADVISVSILKANGVAADSIKENTVFTGTSEHGHAFVNFANLFGMHGGVFADDPAGSPGLTIIVTAVLASLLSEALLKGGAAFIAVRGSDELFGMMMKAGQKARKGVAQASQGRRQLHQARFSGMKIQSRERAYRGIQNRMGNSGNSAVRFMGRRLQNSIAGGGLRDPLADSATYRAEEMKKAEAINATGDDTQLRALTVNKSWALEHGGEATEANGMKGEWRRTARGGRQFKTLSGNKWVDESDVDAAYTRWGNNQAMLQWSLGHEMDKATTSEDQAHVRDNFSNLTYQGSMGDKIGNSRSWNLNDGEMTGLWTGAAFAKQNTNRVDKHYKWDADTKSLKLDRNSLARELYNKKGPYELGQTHADTWETYANEVGAAKHDHDRLATKARTATLSAKEQNQFDAHAEFLALAREQADRLKAGSMTPATTTGGAPTPGPVSSTIGAGSIAGTGRAQQEFVNQVDSILGGWNTGPGSVPPPGAGGPRSGRPQPPIPVGGP